MTRLNRSKNQLNKVSKIHSIFKIIKINFIFYIEAIDFIKPKVIPLIRNQESDPKLNKTGTNAVEAAKNKEQTNEPEVANGSELTLLDLISKMQEKLISSNSTNVKTPAQHILSNLTPVIKRKHLHLLIQSLIPKIQKKYFYSSTSF